MLESGLARRSALTWNALSSLTALLEAVAGYVALESMRSLRPAVLGVPAATFICVAVADLIPSLHERRVSSARLLGPDARPAAAGIRRGRLGALEVQTLHHAPARRAADAVHLRRARQVAVVLLQAVLEALRWALAIVWRVLRRERVPAPGRPWTRFAALGADFDTLARDAVVTYAAVLRAAQHHFDATQGDALPPSQAF